ncbi:NYN domain-containing protein [Fusibacter paucivorans]|uniref:NYN domain-containing protein n=1 Tax=Fusibacter paucivorans TaxID=76009 RepID=UPI001BCC60FB|nr:NYN domain-containing protein [Fusibacter paucivorans]
MTYKGKLYEKRFLFIDGYNLINQWQLNAKNESLEEGRQKLIALLSEYRAYRNERVIVVFDAYQVKSARPKIEKAFNLEIVYTKENQTADSYIEIEVERLAADPRHYIRVVTGDWAQQQMILGSGAYRMTAREFKEELQRVKKRIEMTIEKRSDRHTLEEALSHEIVEKLKHFKD